MACCPLPFLSCPCLPRHSSTRFLASPHLFSCQPFSLVLALPCPRRLRAAVDDPSDAATVSLRTFDQEKEELAAKLAAAEAEADSLKKELAARKADRDVDLAKLKPATPDKRIDGTGYRETLFSGPGKDNGERETQPSDWGLLEAELFLSKGAPTEGSTLAGAAMDDEANGIVRRRLLIGLGITILAVGLSFLKLPVGLVKPPKPLFFYLVPIVRLREQLKVIEGSSSDAKSVRQSLQKALDQEVVSKDTFLSAAGWLEGDDADKAVSLTFSIFDYLNQADYNKYFESLGQPSTTQHVRCFLEHGFIT